MSSFDTLGEVFTSIPIGSFAAAFVWIAATCLQVKPMKQGELYTGGQRRIDAAVKKGNVVVAHLERIFHAGSQSDPDRYRFQGVYGYTVRGKAYRKSLFQSSRNFDESLTLYFDKRPGKAKTAGEMKAWSDQILPRIVPLALAVLTYTLLT